MKVIITTHAAQRMHERAPEIPERNYEKIIQLAHKRHDEREVNLFTEQIIMRNEGNSFPRARVGQIPRACVLGEYVYVCYEEGDMLYFVTVLKKKTVIERNGFRIIHRG